MRNLIPQLLYFFIRLLGSTLRIGVEDRAGIVKGTLKKPVIIIMWHNRILVAPYMYRRVVPDRKASVLTSASKDGEILSQVIQRFHIGVVRGSSSRRGAVAMREMIAVLESGADMTITPDGPRGPVYQFGPGALKLAELTGAALLPYRIRYRSFWELKTWDRFQIPKPFSRVDIVIGPLEELSVPAVAGQGEEGLQEAFAGERKRVEAALATALTRVTD